MGRMLDAARSFLDRDGWVVSPKDDATVLRVAHFGSNGEYGVLVRAREEGSQLIVYSVCPHVVAEPMRARVAEYLTRVNWGMPYGNFELHFATGEVRFRTSMSIEDAEPVDALLRPLIYANVHTMDRYLHDIIAVARGTLPPSLLDDPM